ncbi:hypothetical protein IAD21_03956 [Abditibacteriota bacterium]|nr:hypothetical protein IAD21_03956 [Abditibacteriota bacterium]
MNRFTLLAACLIIAGCAAPRTQVPSAHAAPMDEKEAPGEGADVILGGVGVEAGKFDRLRDITFGADGRLYTLETAGRDSTTAGDITGLGRVQIFDQDGHLQSTFSLGADAQADRAVNEKNEDGLMAAARIAVDGQNRVYVSFPLAGGVRVFDASGKKISDIPLPAAKALARGRDGKIVAVTSCALIRDDHWVWDGGDAFYILSPTAIERKIPLSQTLWNVQDADVAPDGDLIVLGAPAAEKYDWNPQPLLWRFDETGKVVSSIGSGQLTRSEDGSEPLHSVTVAKDGGMIAMTYGNPGFLVRYSSDGKNISRRAGQFRWAEAWSTHSDYTALALAPDGRLWVAVTRPNDPKDPNIATRHSRPVVLRAEANFFAPSQKGVMVADTRASGFAPTLQSPLPYNIAYEVGKPIEVDVVVPPARRTLDTVNISFRVFDAMGEVVTSGQKTLDLQGVTEARLPLSWTPPKFGAYSVVVDYKAGGTVLMSQANHFGVTPRFTNMPVLSEGQSRGDWEDAPRQVFVGLDLMRLHPSKGDDKLQTDLALAKQNGATVFVQLTDKKADFTPERATQVMNAIKGKVRYIELFNEPNFQFSPEEYATRAQVVYNAVKAIDPTVQVLGPAVCGMNLDWHEGFYKAGGKTTCDILSVHDYEGHESISPEHWRWKVGALRQLMTRYGDGTKPMWQTERAISSVRGGVLTGLSQAIRVTLQRDLWSSLGVPDDHNSHYYLNQGGYASVPSYEWSAQGPLPAAMATRARAAFIGTRPWVSNLDFGPTGNTLFLGARYRDATGETISVRNLIGAPMKAAFAVPAEVRVLVVDAWGNVLPIAPQNGTLTLELSQLPTYVRLSGTGTLTPKTWDWGQNLALNARVSITGKAENDPQNLTNGKLDTIHDGNPSGGTDGKQVVRLTEFSPTTPALVSLELGAPKRFDHVIVRGLRADNQFGALRDFDVQVRENGTWRTVATEKTDIPPTVMGTSADATAITFYGDDNAWIVSFAPVQSDAVRLVIRDATRGFEPDELAREQVAKAWGSANPLAASLREIEIYDAP